MPSRSLTLCAVLIAAPTFALAQTSTNPATSTSAGSGALAQYSSQGDASSKCSGDTVVWANPNSKALHTSGDRYFGKSKRGFYACEKDAMAAGYHMAGHRHHKHVAKTG